MPVQMLFPWPHSIFFSFDISAIPVSETYSGPPKIYQFPLASPPVGQRDFPWTSGREITSLSFRMCERCKMRFAPADDFWGFLDNILASSFFSRRNVLSSVVINCFIFRVCSRRTPTCKIYRNRRGNMREVSSFSFKIESNINQVVCRRLLCFRSPQSLCNDCPCASNICTLHM